MIRNTPPLPVILLLGRKWRRKMETMIMMIRMMVGHRSMGSTIWSSAAWVIITLIKIRAAHLCDKQLIRISPPVWLIKTAQKDHRWQDVLVRSREDCKITYPSHKWSVAGITGARKGANAERKMFFSSSASTIPEIGHLGINVNPPLMDIRSALTCLCRLCFGHSNQGSPPWTLSPVQLHVITINPHFATCFYIKRKVW